MPASSAGLPFAAHRDGWVSPSPVPLADGSSAQLFKDGEALQAAYAAIEGAQNSILLEAFIFKADDTGREFADLLIRRAKDGLDVRVMYDWFGSISLQRDMFVAMQSAGVKLRAFHALTTRNLFTGRVFSRDHRKVLIVDDTFAVLGGQNLGDEYGGSWIHRRSRREEWRDSAVGVRGPCARLLSAAYVNMWEYVHGLRTLKTVEYFCSAALHPESFTNIQFGDVPRGRGWRRRPPSPGASELDAGENSMAVLASVPTSHVKLLGALKRLLRDATTSIELTMAYFAPPNALVDQLCSSARRGVRVRLMLPSRSDVPLMVSAARAIYEPLLAAGVEIYEREGVILHAKTLCVDGRVSIIGSTNLDYWSIQGNSELSVVINSTGFAAQMHALFEHDVAHSRRIHGTAWRRRPVRDRVIQWLVFRVRGWL